VCNQHHFRDQRLQDFYHPLDERTPCDPDQGFVLSQAGTRSTGQNDAA